MAQEFMIVLHAVFILINMSINIIYDRKASRLFRDASGAFRNNGKAFLGAALMGNMTITLYFLSRFFSLLLGQNFGPIKWIFDAVIVVVLIGLLLAGRKLILTMTEIRTEVFKE
jgi:protein-S-isoprenylcysteine O-methyltransferase Ste14